MGIAIASRPSAETAGFPIDRPRRLRRTTAIRELVREHRISPSDLILPLFVCEGTDIQRPIGSMPGQFNWSIDRLGPEVASLGKLGIHAVMLFGIPKSKDDCGSDNFNPDGIVPRAIRAIKDANPEMIVISDMCFCEYTDHGHCGLINVPESAHFDASLPHGYLLNDPSLELLARASVVHAEAGADMIAPSAMLDGQVGAIRAALDQTGFEHIPVMAYAAKFASGFYGPFREAAQSAPSFGDRKQYQMDPANRREAMREAELDVAEGADIIMVKPALPYLDIVSDLRATFDLPIAAYQVSGEYAMLHAAAANGWIDLRRCAMESLIGIKRAGADMILTYFAKDVAGWSNG
ncbi:MAG: porphobilinogen synthase [Thermomicrobiales bacterium]